jgi:membrane-bound metal-dependent hydrolase YbcI (DUF457 family)
MKTHLAVSIVLILLFLPTVTHPVSFVVIALVATLLPDIDSSFSTLGKHRTFRPIQSLVRHRGLFHSFTFLFLITFFFVLFLPVVALPLFLTYSLHIFLDSFTIEGVRPFYPFKKNISGKIRTGGKFETGFFMAFVFIDVLLFFFWINSLF